MSSLHIPSGENSLLKAFRQVVAKKEDASTVDYAQEYNKNFTTVVEPFNKEQSFVRFSLADQTINTIVKSTSV